MIAGSILKEETVDIDNWNKNTDVSYDDILGTGNNRIFKCIIKNK